MRFRWLPNWTQRRAAARLVALAASATSTGALASFLSGEALDSVASGIAWFVICVVPIVVIVLFWLVHVMPEKIALKRHHPQRDAIHVLCLLSLVFGGLLWPIGGCGPTKGARTATSFHKRGDYYGVMGTRRAPASCCTTSLRICVRNSTRWQPRGSCRQG